VRVHVRVRVPMKLFPNWILTIRTCNHKLQKFPLFYGILCGACIHENVWVIKE